MRHHVPLHNNDNSLSSVDKTGGVTFTRRNRRARIHSHGKHTRACIIKRVNRSLTLSTTVNFITKANAFFFLLSTRCSRLSARVVCVQCGVFTRPVEGVINANSRATRRLGPPPKTFVSPAEQQSRPGGDIARSAVSRVRIFLSKRKRSK